MTSKFFYSFIIPQLEDTLNGLLNGMRLDQIALTLANNERLLEVTDRQAINLGLKQEALTVCRTTPTAVPDTLLTIRCSISGQSINLVLGLLRRSLDEGGETMSFEEVSLNSHPLDELNVSAIVSCMKKFFYLHFMS